MMNYKKLREKQQKEVNDFPMFFAFSNKQFNEGMEKIGLKPENTDLIYKLGYGGFYKKTDSKALHSMFDKHEKELKDSFQDERFIYDAFSYELGNHEYCITYDETDTLNALNLTMDEVNKNEAMKRLLRKACQQQIDNSCW